MVVRETERGSFIIDRRAQAKPATEVVMLRRDEGEGYYRQYFVAAGNWERLSDEAREALRTEACLAVVGAGPMTLERRMLNGLRDLLVAATARGVSVEVIADLNDELEEMGEVPLDLPEPAAEMYYIRDTRQTVGNSVLWWGHGNKGYVSELRDAGLYTRADALHIAARRSTDVPYAQSTIEAVAAHHVRAEALYAAEPLTGGEP